ncbi:MAG: Fic family protein [bacterium]|nr:Fic family protein [bacterium]
MRENNNSKTAIKKRYLISFELVMNHPFLDGNKRIGAYVLTVGLKLNGIPFSLCSFTVASFSSNVNFI